MADQYTETVRAIEAQKWAARSCVPTGCGEWSDGYVAALDWVLARIVPKCDAE
mgnify:CR=1 FL=1